MITRMVTDQPEEPQAPTVAGPLHLLGATPDERRALVAELGLEPYRAAQLGRWVWEKGAASVEAMTDLSKEARQRLSSRAMVRGGQVADISRAGDGTSKLLIRWTDGACVECVWIPDERRHTACLSSQVGCPVGCRFCASGLEGVERNLTAGEIVEQAMQIRALLPPGERLSNVVMMGMGEPLANYAAVVKAIRLLNAPPPDGMGIGARRITLSTVGLPAQIRRLAGEGLSINLALSLHCPDEKLRRELIPWGRGVPIRELIDACVFYFERTGREVTLEYVLLEGVNMEPLHAAQLAAICRRLRCNVNLLRYNPVPGLPYRRPAAETAFAFQRLLRDKGVNAHIRRSRGVEADAACGQLRRRTGLTVAGAAASDGTAERAAAIE